MVSWDQDYTPVREDETGGAAVCRVARREGDASAGTSYTQGVLGYDLGLLRGIALELTGSRSQDAGLARSIAESLRFDPVAEDLD